MNPDLRGVVLGLTGIAVTTTTTVAFAGLGFWEGVIVAFVGLTCFGIVGAGTEG